MKSLTMLWFEVLEEFSTWCHTSTVHDRKTVMDRLTHEGESFLTITLPNFGKDFEKSLDDGRILASSFKGWKKSKPSRGVMPLFLGGIMERVFCRETGVLLDEPDIDAIFAIRQLTLMFGKILLPCSDARVKKAFDSYIECEQEIRRNDAELSSAFLEEFQKTSRIMYGSVLQKIDEDIYYGRIVPRHGPGATADRLTGNGKFDQVEWTERLEVLFPFGEYALPNWRYHDNLSRVEFLEPGAERPVKVISVPKTLKTPRIIAVEPTCMQYVQQGLMAKFVEYIERDSFPARGMVGFSDQVPNQHLACLGSSDGSLATLDLSEASDRVSNQLVRAMLESYPHLAAGIDACRSRKADVPGHGVIRLAKFASMGSAVTFPIEAIVFSTVAVMGIAAQLNTPVSKRLVESLADRVRVYGDDIIVPVESVSTVVDYLETFGFKVNRNKSFWTGRFRESCGREYYDGQNVSIARVRRHLPDQLFHVEEVMSTVSLRNQLYQLGLWRSAAYLDRILERVLNGHFPVTTPESPVLGRESVSFGYENQKMHATLHTPLVRGYVPVSKQPRSEASGIGSLLKCLLKQGEQPFADSEHLLRGGRPKAVDIKLRWRQPF